MYLGGLRSWTHYLVGVAPGEPGQPTALCVVEQVVRLGRGLRDETAELRQSHLEEVPGGTPLPDLAARIAAVRAAAAREDEHGSPGLLVDVSILGDVLPDMLARLLPVSVAVTGGLSSRRLEHRNGWAVPRRELAGALLLAVQQGSFRTAGALPLAGRFGQALQGFRLSPPAAGGDDALDAVRRQADDGLVVAAAMCAWQAARAVPGPRRQAGWPGGHRHPSADYDPTDLPRDRGSGG